MKKRKVIIDCDPGIDDSLALLLVLNSPELEVLGITICSGNVPAKLGAKNALKTLQICSSLHIPVYVGEEYPLERELVTAQDTHGEDGLGENFYSDIGELQFNYGGTDFILDNLRNHKNISIIALGPLTNIAKALVKDREAFENLDEVISMGGAFRIHGNCSPVAEFNYWVDPHAADYVYKNLPRKIHMVGLDVTRKVVLTPNIVEFINRLDKNLGKYITEITRFYVDFHWKQEGIIGCVINDPLAVAYFIDRSICSGFESSVIVMKNKERIRCLILISLGIVINIIGAFLALTFKLPIYLDSIGTILIACLLGPKYAVITGLCGSIVSGITFDVYSLYFAPVQVTTGLLAGVMYKKGFLKGKKSFIGVLIFSIPTSLISAIIAAYLFGGITSSGSTYIVQAFKMIGINPVISVFITQAFTDYIDKFIGVQLVSIVLNRIPSSLKERLWIDTVK